MLPFQLDNLARKLQARAAVALIHGDSAELDLPAASYDRALLFFLLHEQPEAVRLKTLAEALRVVKPGGEVVIVDYHRPHRWKPLRLPMAGALRALEPFALDLWRREITERLPASVSRGNVRKKDLL